MSISKESFMFTVGKLDAGMAILLGERAHLIEFPSILLPPGATAGSIVNIAVQQNHEEEQKRDREFWGLQDDILESFGRQAPEPPKLQLRNVTQTSVTLEWPSLQLATAKLRSLDIYRNGQRLAAIPSPHTNTSTKLSGLELDTEYTFQLFLRTTAGTYPSNIIRIRTHTMTDTSGISVCFGNVQDTRMLEQAKAALREMRARWSDKIEIDTTHFVCTTPAAIPSSANASGNASTAPGVEYQRALQLSIPVVTPAWILACLTEHRMVPIAGYYLGATPGSMNTPSFTRPQSMSQVTLPHSPVRQNSSSTNLPKGAGNRASMPPMGRGGPYPEPPLSPASAESAARTQAFGHERNTDSKGSVENSPNLDRDRPAPERRGSGQAPASIKEEAEDDNTTPREEAEPRNSATRDRKGTMNKDFKFPGAPPRSSSIPDVPPLPTGAASPPARKASATAAKNEPAEPPAPRVIAPSSIEVPPPPPVEKERRESVHDEGDEDVGATEEIPL